VLDMSLDMIALITLAEDILRNTSLWDLSLLRPPFKIQIFSSEAYCSSQATSRIFSKVTCDLKYSNRPCSSCSMRRSKYTDTERQL